jgi:hypothetical protein
MKGSAHRIKAADQSAVDLACTNHVRGEASGGHGRKAHVI